MPPRSRSLIAFFSLAIVCILLIASWTTSLAALPLRGEAVWEAIGPWGGEVYNVTVSPHDPLIMYARSRAGISRSLDGGASWKLVEDYADATGMMPVVVNPLTPSHLVATQEYQNSYIESVDGGENWIERTLPFDPRTLLFHPTLPNTLYAITEEGTYRANKGGPPWLLIEFPNGSSPLYLLAHPTNGTLYASNESGVYVSMDGGDNWTLRNSGAYELKDFHAPSNTLVAFWDGMVHKSSDGGIEWSAIYLGLPEAHHPLYVVIDPHNPTRLFMTLDDNRVYRTTADGTQWEIAESIPPGDGDGWLAVAPTTPSTLFYPNQGLYKSNDQGATWEPTYMGLSSLKLGPIAADPSNGASVMVGYRNYLYRSDTGGTHWTTTEFATTHTISTLTYTPDGATVYMGTASKGIWRSDDGGATWKNNSTGLPTTSPNNYQNIIEIAVAPNDPQRLIAVLGVSTLYYSENGGTSWLPADDPTFYSIRHALFDTDNPAIVWAPTEGGLLKSSDGGEQWQMSATPGIPAAADMRSMAIDPATGTLYIGLLEDNRIFRSTDDGASWEPLPTGLPATVTITALWSDPLSPDTLLFAANRLDQYDRVEEGYGIYRSTDGGDTWDAFMVGLVYPAVMQLVGDGTFTYATTDLAGAYRLESPLVLPPTPTPTRTPFPGGDPVLFLPITQR